MSEFCCQSLNLCTGALVTAIGALAWCLKIEVQNKKKSDTLHVLLVNPDGSTSKVTAESADK